MSTLMKCDPRLQKVAPGQNSVIKQDVILQYLGMCVC